MPQDNLTILGIVKAVGIQSPMLGCNASPIVMIHTDSTLVTSGPSRWVRQPLYLMGLIEYIGYALLAENWFSAWLRSSHLRC